MKVEDMKFPIEVFANDGDREYKVTFTGRSLFKRCCDCKFIKGEVKSRVALNKVKGFKNKRGSSVRWEKLEYFKLCSMCGEFKVLVPLFDYTDIVRAVWLKTIKKNKRRRK